MSRLALVAFLLAAPGWSARAEPAARRGGGDSAACFEADGVTAGRSGAAYGVDATLDPLDRAGSLRRQARSESRSFGGAGMEDAQYAILDARGLPRRGITLLPGVGDAGTATLATRDVTLG